jgi:hypothetical protein
VSPFIVFCNEHRDEIKAANPNVQFGEIGRLLAIRWKEMSDRERMAYVVPYSARLANGIPPRETRHAPAPTPATTPSEPEMRRSSRLRNKRLGLDFWGLKINK